MRVLSLASPVVSPPSLWLCPRGVPQGAYSGEVEVYGRARQVAHSPPNPERQLTRTLVIARIAALSTQALAYFLQAVRNAAIGLQALHLRHPKHMLQRAVTTVQRA